MVFINIELNEVGNFDIYTASNKFIGTYRTMEKLKDDFSNIKASIQSEGELYMLHPDGDGRLAKLYNSNGTDYDISQLKVKYYDWNAPTLTALSGTHTEKIFTYLQ